MWCVLESEEKVWISYTVMKYTSSQVFLPRETNTIKKAIRSSKIMIAYFQTAEIAFEKIFKYFISLHGVCQSIYHKQIICTSFLKSLVYGIYRDYQNVEHTP